MIKRRMFLAGLLGAGGLLSLSFYRSRDEDAIAAIVHRRLEYLKLDAAGVRRFAGDFASRRMLSSGRLRAVAAVWPIYRRLPLSGSDSWVRRVDLAEERIVSNYLISTDFFANGANPSQLVSYLGFYDALKACGNPFHRAVEA